MKRKRTESAEKILPEKKKGGFPLLSLSAFHGSSNPIDYREETTVVRKRGNGMIQREREGNKAPLFRVQSGSDQYSSGRTTNTYPDV